MLRTACDNDHFATEIRNLGVWVVSLRHVVGRAMFLYFSDGYLYD
jgi:hypothetical protein